MDRIVRRYGVQLLLFAVFYGLSCLLPSLAESADHHLGTPDGLLLFALKAPLYLRLPALGLLQVLLGVTVWHAALYWKQTRGVASLSLMVPLLLGWPYVVYHLPADVAAWWGERRDRATHGPALNALSKAFYRLSRAERYTPGQPHYYERVTVPYRRGPAPQASSGVDTLDLELTQLPPVEGLCAVARRYRLVPWRLGEAYHQVSPGVWSLERLEGTHRSGADTLYYVRCLSYSAAGRVAAAFEPAGVALRRRALEPTERHALDSLAAASGLSIAQIQLYPQRRELWLITRAESAQLEAWVQVNREGEPWSDAPFSGDATPLRFTKTFGLWYRASLGETLAP